MKLKEINIAVIGQGYVGLPLAIEFGKNWPVVGFDINKKRIEELKLGFDGTKEVNKSQIKSAKQLRFSYNIDEISKCNVYIVTVPTPIDKYKTPDLSPLKKASEMLSKIIKQKDIIIYESTVFPRLYRRSLRADPRIWKQIDF